jgi:HD-like signal output (HDOD) protein
MAGKLGGAIMRSWEFTGEFVEVTENWNNLEFQTEQVSYIDFVRIGAIYKDVIGENADKNELLSVYIEKGILPDLDFLGNDEFIAALNDVKSVFA